MPLAAGSSLAEQRFTTALSCAVTTPALRSVLLLDADPARFEHVAEVARSLLEDLTGAPVRRVRIGSMDDDDRLFGAFGLVEDAGSSAPRIAYRRGPLDQSEDDPAAIRLVTIADVTRLGLSAARACVALIGADVAHLERHGQHRLWSPNLFWLAGCARADVGEVSPHLLDRFALRLDAAPLEPPSGLPALKSYLEGGAPHGDASQRAALPARWKAAAGRRIDLTDEALDAALSAFEPGAGPISPRRPTALAWLALALARADEAATRLTEDHVARAADLIGLHVKLKPRPAPVEPLPPPEPAPPQDVMAPAPGGPAPPIEKPMSPPPPAPSAAASPAGPLLVDRQSIPPSEQSAVHLPGEQDTTYIASTSPSPGDPYPEDSALVTREATPLRLPFHRAGAARAARGTIVGVMRAADLQDLALTATLIEAAKYQSYRRSRLERAREEQLPGAPPRSPDRLIVFPEDLRRYRRVPPPESLLVLVLDHTCLDGWDWGAAVLPYLRDAYTERAAVSVVQVGAADADNELRARIVSARSLREPQISAALAAEPGTATPLAHGLELATETLRMALQHGRGAALRARLVVITDGRGNVPVQASHEGRISMPVTDQGVRDAMLAAAALKALPRVASALIHSSPRYHRDLPVKLGRALGAEVLTAAPIEEEEEP